MYLQRINLQSMMYSSYERDFSGTHWLEDSLYIPEDLFQQMELEKIFNICLNHFSYFWSHNSNSKRVE